LQKNLKETRQLNSLGEFEDSDLSTHVPCP